MPMANSGQGAAGGVFGAVVGLVARALLAVAGLIFFVSALVAGLIATLVVLVWALLTGRRPTIVRFGSPRWRVHPGAGMSGSRPGGTAAPARGRGDVIDVEVREVPPESRRD